MPKFDCDDVVRVNPAANPELRPGAKAWVVGVVPEDKRVGSYFEQFQPGVIYTVEYEDGTSHDVHETDLQADNRRG